MDCWFDNKQYNSVPVRLLTRALSHTLQGNGNGSYVIKELDNNTIISGTYSWQLSEMIARGEDGTGRLFFLIFFVCFVSAFFLSMYGVLFSLLFFKFHFEESQRLSTDNNDWEPFFEDN